MNGLTNPFGTLTNMFEGVKKELENQKVLDRLEEAKLEIDKIDILHATRDRQILIGLFYAAYVQVHDIKPLGEQAEPEPENAS